MKLLKRLTKDRFTITQHIKYVSDQLLKVSKGNFNKEFMIVADFSYNEVLKLRSIEKMSRKIDHIVKVLF